jgi:SNF2 family DNA or RNA helicase
MLIDFDEKINKFLIRSDPQSLEYVRSMPNRRFDKEQGLWHAGMTQANAYYLLPFNGRMTIDAKKAVELILKGPVIKKGSLPHGFNFKSNPFSHQLEPLLRMRIMDAYALLMDPGTGKTKVLIDDAICAFLEKRINAVLVVCPNSIKSNWVEEIEKHSDFSRQEVHVCDAVKKKTTLEWIKKAFPGKLKWLIMAVESYSHASLASIGKEFSTLHRASIIIDESSRIKTHNRNRTKALITLGAYGTLRRIATGTPISKGLHQAWSQFEFLDPNIIDTSYYPFRNRFCVMGGFQGKQVMGMQNESEFFDLITPYAFRASKAECLKELPPKVYQTRKVTPSDEQKRFYETLLKTLSIELEEGKTVTALNTLVRDLRLQQIAGGFITTDPLVELPNSMEALEELVCKQLERKAEPISGENPKIEELMEIIEEYPGKMIIWSRFKPEIAAIVSRLRKEFGEQAVVEFHGDIKNDQRTLARQRFQEDPTCLFFVGQIQTGGIGITLTAASHVVYFSNSWSLEDRVQSEDRCHRISQEAESVIYIDLLTEAKNWVDEKVLKALKAGKSYTDIVLGRIEEATYFIDTSLEKKAVSFAIDSR